MYIIKNGDRFQQNHGIYKKYEKYDEILGDHTKTQSTGQLHYKPTSQAITRILGVNLPFPIDFCVFNCDSILLKLCFLAETNTKLLGDESS